ncbi:hypothetical protein BH09VER1_BH09VER1_31520 [soil metagenome]
MANRIQHLTLVLIALCGLPPLSGAPSPSAIPEDIAGQALALWKSNKIPQLGQYLRHQSTTTPDYAPAVVAGAFYDYIFLGKLLSAKARLLRIATIAQANPETFPEVYRGYIAAALNKLNEEIRLGRARGMTEDNWQANANPQAVRTTMGTNLFPILTLLLVTPKVTLPAP